MGTRKYAIALFVLMTVILFRLPDLHARGYRSLVWDVTKQGRIYDGKTWDAKLLWNATLVTDHYRRAREEKHVALHHLDALAAAQWVAAEERNHADGWEVFIGFYAKKDYKKFELSPDSFWEIFLTLSSGEMIAPTSIEMVPVTPYELLLYPYLNRWSKAYRVIFPKVDLRGRPRLTLQSVVGSSTLTWKFAH